MIPTSAKLAKTERLIANDAPQEPTIMPPYIAGLFQAKLLPRSSGATADASALRLGIYA